MLWGDDQVERVMGSLLRCGVLIAGAVILAGGVCYVVRHGAATPDYHTFRGEPSQLRSVAGVVDSALGGDCRGIIQLGLLLLIATPVARVAFSVFAFALERDKTFVAVTLMVLAALTYSLGFSS